MSILSDLAAGVPGLLGTVYNLYTNKRDFDYQKALQSKVFQREDTAVQRRMQDLQAAGINPNLAAGSAAASGSVVSRSNTNDVNMGSALDTIAALNQIKQQKQQTENLNKESKILDLQYWKTKFEADNQEDNWLQNRMLTLSQMGLPFYTYYDDNGVPRIWYDTYQQNLKHKSNFSELFNYQIKNAQNSAAMLQKELNAYDIDRLLRNTSLFMPDLYAGINFGYGTKKLKK